MLARALPGVAGAGRRRSLSLRPARRAPARRHGPPARRWLSASRAGARRRSAAAWPKTICRIGRCRPAGCAKPLDAARAADAALDHRRLRHRGRSHRPRASASRRCSASRGRSARRAASAGDRDSVVVPSNSRVFVVAGIARPERFFADILVGRLGHLPARIAFRDHHRFTARDVAADRRRGEGRRLDDRADDREGRGAAGGLRPRRPADRRRCR